MLHSQGEKGVRLGGKRGVILETQYVPMAIMRIFWAECAHPDLNALYQSTRSVPMSDREGAMVGYDCPVEWLNGAITDGVQSHVTLERIEKFVHNHPLYQHNHHIIRAWSQPERERYEAFMKDIESDVNSILTLLIEKVGATWHAVCQRSTWQNSQPPCPQLFDIRDVPPWQEVERAMTQGGNDSVSVFICRTVRRLTGNYYSWRA